MKNGEWRIGNREQAMGNRRKRLHLLGLSDRHSPYPHSDRCDKTPDVGSLPQRPPYLPDDFPSAIADAVGKSVYTPGISRPLKYFLL